MDKPKKVRKPKMVEIARSFSLKVNCGNYESADFFASQKAECKVSEQDKVSEALYQFCKAEVARAVSQFKADLEREKNAKIRAKEIYEEQKTHG